MPPILFPTSTAPGKDAIESAGRLVNAFAEKIQAGGPAGQIIRRTPGLRLFGDSTQNAIRGLWYDGSSAVYAAYTSALAWFDSAGTETVVGSIPDGAVAFSGIFGSTADASSYTLTGIPFGDAAANRRLVVGVPAMEYAGPELITNGTFTSDLSGWAAGAEWTWNAGAYAHYVAPPATDVIVNGTFNSDLSGWTVVEDGASAPGGAWQWFADANPYARAAVPTGYLSGTLTQTILLAAGTTYQIRVTPRVLTGISPGLGSPGTIYVMLDGVYIYGFNANAGTQAINIAGTGTNRVLGFRAVQNFSDRHVGIDDVAVVPIAFPVSPLAQSVTTTAGVTYTLSVGSGGSGTINITIDGAVIHSFSAASGGTTIALGGSGTTRTLGFTTGSVTGFIGIDNISLKSILFALPTAVSIGGVGATQSVASAGTALWIANVPTGTSGNVALTYAQAMNEASVAVWRLNNVTSSTPSDTVSIGDTVPVTATVDVSPGSVSIFLAQYVGSTPTGSGVMLDATDHPSIYVYASAFSGRASASGTASVSATYGNLAGATWAGATTSLGNGLATFAKNNKLPSSDQLLCISGTQVVPFTQAGIAAPLNVNSEVPTSVCFGEGYFFVTTTTGRCYASAINDITFNSLDSIRAEQRPEPLTRGVWYNGELLLFGPTHTEVWASRGNPNPTGFPLNYVTSISRGISGTLAVTGFEEGFEGGIFWVADDHSVRMLQGYEPKIISPPALERAIAMCANKNDIRVFCYDVDGHACVTVDLAGESTWVYDLIEGGLWHERDTAGLGYWRATGNSIHGFDVWIVGDHLSGNLYRVDDTIRNDGGETMPVVIESIAMETFPQRLKVSRAEFNFISGVGNAAVPDPEVEISWSDTGGHRWSDPMIRKLGEDGRYYEQIRVNGLGMTGIKGRRFRLRIEDEVEVGLLAGSMDVATL